LLFTRKQIDKRAIAVHFDATVEFIWFAGMLAPRSKDHSRTSLRWRRQLPRRASKTISVWWRTVRPRPTGKSYSVSRSPDSHERLVFNQVKARVEYLKPHASISLSVTCFPVFGPIFAGKFQFSGMCDSGR
jgi:hypothetical protein